jgi:hypothetical protein
VTPTARGRSGALPVGVWASRPRWGGVRAAGGHADEPVRRPFGLLAECVDDQGGTFRRWQPAD